MHSLGLFGDAAKFGSFDGIEKVFGVRLTRKIAPPRVWRSSEAMEHAPQAHLQGIYNPPKKGGEYC